MPGRSEGLAAVAVLLAYGLAVTFLQRPYEDAIFGLGLAAVIAAGAARGLRAGLVMSVAVAAVNVMVVLVGATEELGPALARSALFLAAHALGGASIGVLGEGLRRERARAADRRAGGGVPGHATIP